MSEHSNWSPEEREELIQELLELHFGCHENPQQLEARLAREPQLRALQAEVQGQADVLEEAVKPEQPRLQLPTGDPAAAPVAAQLAARRPRWYHLPLARMTVALAAAALVIVGILAFEQANAWQLDAYRTDHLHLTVSAPRAVPTGAPLSFTVETNDLHGTPSDCRIVWTSYGESGELLATGEAPTEGGSATITMPPHLVVPTSVEVIASNQSDEAKQIFALSTAYASPLVHVSTDRPVYRPGEPVFVRVTVLDRVTRMPLGRASPMLAELLDAKGAAIANDFDAVAPHGVGSFRFTLPASSAGGVHKVRVRSHLQLFPEEHVEIIVRPFRNSQLKKEIELDRKSYAPGARGAATVTAMRLGDGQPCSLAKVRGAVIVDGNEVWSEESGLGANGEITFRFQIPKEIDKGAARFVAQVTDSGVVESTIAPFVVPTGKVSVAAFPEGGELIAGVENGLYLECTDALDRAIDTTGELIDADGRRVASFRTQHQGRVRMTFVPEKGKTYRVRVAGKAETFELSPVRDSGVAMRLLGDDIGPEQPLRMALGGRGNGPWVLGVFCRGVMVAQTTLRPDASGQLQARPELDLPDTAIGVLRATVFDRNLQPIAERLLRRRSSHTLDVKLAAEHNVLAPGDRQQVKVTAIDETGEPARAVLGVRCTDVAATSLGDEPRISLVDQAMLFGDVQKMEDLGDFFLSNENGGRNADLLLGTRGWRRFVWRNDAAAKQAIVDAGDFGKGVLAREGFSQTPQVRSNLKAAMAPIGNLTDRAWRTEKWRDTAIAISVALLLLLGITEFVAWILRRARNASPVMQSFTGVAVAVSLLAGLLFLLQQGLGAEAPLLSARLQADDAMPDFEGEARFEQLIEREEGSPMPVTGVPWDTVTTYGAFFNDGVDGDIRARTLQFDYFGGVVNGLADLPANQAAARLGDVSLVDELSIVRRFREIDEQSQAAYFLPPNIRNIPTAGGWDDLSIGFDPAPFVAGSEATTGGRAGNLADHRLRTYGTYWTQRQYAHRHVASEQRRDFTPTIYWDTLVTTDERGEAMLAFATSDAATTWKVEADAHISRGEIGRLGQASTTFTTQLPLQIEPKLPDEVSSGDRLLLPVSAVLKDARHSEVALTMRLGAGLRLGADAPKSIALDGDKGATGRGRALVPVEVIDFVGTTTITIEARAGTFVDRVRHTLQVAPRGFPHHRAAGGRTNEGNHGEWQLAIPADAVPGSGTAKLVVYPSPIAALTEGLQGILREPHGCFEQASSSNYPNTLVLNLIEANGDDLPMVVARARKLLPRGYAKIIGYECTEKGYEWFGNDPGHEALTAYGLLQFHDMAKVYDVDMAMVERTKAWLLSRRDGKGNYPHPKQDHHSFGGRDPKITNAYVTYALLQSGTPEAELKVEIDALVERIEAAGAYELAVIACALNLTERAQQQAARDRLATLQDDGGSIQGAKNTITMSGGRDRIVETTGFAVLAWLRDPGKTGNVRKAVEYLQSVRGGRGTFGATQATIVALRALTAYAAANRTMREDGVLQVFEGDRLLVRQPFSASDTQAMKFELWNQLEPGEHTLRIDVTGGGKSPLAWSGEVRYHAEKPADDPLTKTSLTTALRASDVEEGRTVALDVVLENVTDEELPTPMAIVGLPAGLEISSEVLEDMKQAQRFSYWELKGRELVLYWRKLDASERVELTFDLTARVPGTTRGPASRTYLYYTPEQKQWAQPLEIEVHAAR